MMCPDTHFFLFIFCGICLLNLKIGTVHQNEKILSPFSPQVLGSPPCSVSFWNSSWIYIGSSYIFHIAQSSSIFLFTETIVSSDPSSNSLLFFFPNFSLSVSLRLISRIILFSSQANLMLSKICLLGFHNLFFLFDTFRFPLLFLCTCLTSCTYLLQYLPALQFRFYSWFFLLSLAYGSLFLLCLIFFFYYEPVFFEVLSVGILRGLRLKNVLPERVCIFF